MAPRLGSLCRAQREQVRSPPQPVVPRRGRAPLNPGVRGDHGTTDGAEPSQDFTRIASFDQLRPASNQQAPASASFDQLRPAPASFEASPPYGVTSFEASQKPAKPAKPVTATSL